MTTNATPGPVEVELKSCPFCGSAGSLFDSPNHSTAWEGGCSVQGCPGFEVIWEETKAEAITAWNTRHRTQALADAAAEAEPVAWMYEHEEWGKTIHQERAAVGPRIADGELSGWTETPLYAARPVQSDLVEASPALLDLATASLIEARNALKQHWLDWDGEPEDGWALRLAWAKCDQTLSILAENSFDEVPAALVAKATGDGL